MNEMAFDDTPDERVFTSGGRISLADVLAACGAAMTGNALRDTRSAFRFLERRGGIDLGATLARPQEVRGLLAGLAPALLGVSGKRLANVASLVGAAVSRFGMRRTSITREIALDGNWTALIGGIPDRRHRWALSRLACYCTVKRIAPAEVTPETLRGLHAALEAEALSKDPRNLLKQTIAVWNVCLRHVPGLPAAALHSPFRSEPFMLPLEALAEPFRREVARFEERMSNPDPLDPDAPSRGFRPATIEAYRLTFRRAASALLRGGVLEPDQLTGFEVILEPGNFREALRPFLPRSDGRDTGYVHKMATQLIAVGRHHLRLEKARLDELERIARHLKPKTSGMGRRNRQRLAQFDDEAIVRRLLRFPEEERDRALRLRNPLRRARGLERALAISILTFTGIRIKNLRQLRVPGNIRRSGRRAFIVLSAAETKTHSELELELPPETIALLDEVIAEARPFLPGSDSAWLFPGPTGKPRSYSAMRDAVGRPLRRYAGVELSPHLFRHIIARIVAERSPENLHNVSRMLGHKRMNTTYQFYLGTEGPAASRTIGALLRKARGSGDGERP